MKFAVLAVLVVVVAAASANPFGRAVLLDENLAPIAGHIRTARDVEAVRTQRDTGYAPPVHHQHKYKKGKVGPVYTFVKTDYNGNFKWGVRHRAGVQYGR